MSSRCSSRWRSLSTGSVMVGVLSVRRIPYVWGFDYYVARAHTCMIVGVRFWISVRISTHQRDEVIMASRMLWVMCAP